MGWPSRAVRRQWRAVRDGVRGSAALLDAFVRIHGQPPADVRDDTAEASHAR